MGVATPVHLFLFGGVRAGKAFIPVNAKISQILFPIINGLKAQKYLAQAMGTKTFGLSPVP
jgi:hypothetical protein